MEHEMRLAALYHGLGPLVMPYCIRCFKLMQHARERALIEDVEGSK